MQAVLSNLFVPYIAELVPVLHDKLTLVFELKSVDDTKVNDTCRELTMECVKDGIADLTAGFINWSNCSGSYNEENENITLTATTSEIKVIIDKSVLSHQNFFNLEATIGGVKRLISRGIICTYL